MVTADFSDQRGADVCDALVRHEEERFDAGHTAVGECHAELILKIGKGAEAPDEKVDVVVFSKIDDERGKANDGDLRQRLRDLLEHVDFVVHGKKSTFLFGQISGDADVKFVADACASLDHIEMPKRRRIKGAWKKSSFHNASKIAYRAY